MIAYVDKPPTVELLNGGFLVTLASGDTETTFMLTRHALAGLCGKGALRMQESDAREAIFEPTTLTEKGSRRC